MAKSAKRKINVPGNKPAKPAAPPAAKLPITGKPAVPAAPKQTTLQKQAHRDAKYLASASYPGGEYTAINALYLALFSPFCKANPRGVANVAEITLTGVKPPGIPIRNNRARLRLLALSGHVNFIGPDGKPLAIDGETKNLPLTFEISALGKALAVYTTAKPYVAPTV